MPYFDHNATSPLAPIARVAWLRAQDVAWQNPSSPSRAAARVRIRLDTAREQFAALLDSAPKRLVFTSGATEGANAVFTHWARVLPPAARVAVSPTEHPCVLAAARAHLGDARLVWLEVDRNGIVSPAALEKLLSGPAAVAAVAIMAANNETGVLSPWPALAEVCHRASVEFFCDATQWLGKLPASGLGACGWAVASAHKFGGPKGVGLLQIPAHADDFHAQLGGAQEHGQRAGTENFPGVAAMLAALTEAETKKVLFETERLRWRENFERVVCAAVPSAVVVAAGAERLWNTVALLLPHGENHRWVARLDARGFQISTGSACATAKEGPSHVLAALGLTPEVARRVVRVSAGWETTEADWLALAAAFAAAAPEVLPAAQVVSA